MHALIKSLKLSTFILAVVFALVAITFTALAQSTTPSVSLSVDNRASVQIRPGQTVTLRWEARNVSNCSINNGIGAIPAGELPIGSRVVTPPDGEQSSYTLTCQGGSSTVSIKVIPSVDLRANPNPLTIQGNGNGTTRLTWQARNATACTQIRVRPASGLATTYMIPDRSADSSRDFTLSQNTTYTITCVNELLNTTITDDVVVTVNNGTLPPPRITEFTVNPNPATIDPTFAAAQVRVRHNAEFATECRRQAFTMDGEEIVIGPWTNGGKGFFPYSQDLSLPETVRLVLRCGRPADNQWDTREQTVIVNTPANNQPVVVPTAQIIAPDSVTISDAIAGVVSVQVTQRTTGINFCNYTAVDSSNSPISLTGWTNLHRSLNLNTSRNINIRDTVTLKMDCTRIGDGTIVSDSHTIAVTKVTGTPSPLVTVRASALPSRGGVPQALIEWESENTSSCPARTQTLGGNSASFSSNYSTNGSERVAVLGNTLFTVKCVQSGTGAEASNSVSVYLDATGQIGVVEASVTVDNNGGGGDGTGTTTTPTTPTTPITPTTPTTPDSGTMTLEARPSIVRQGDSTTLVWTADPRLTCRLESNGTVVDGFTTSRAGNRPSGTVAINQVAAERIFDLICTGGTQDPNTVSATVRVLPVIQES